MHGILTILIVASWLAVAQAQGLPTPPPPQHTQASSEQCLGKLCLIVITAIHDLTPERQEGRVITIVKTPAEANHKCAEQQQLQASIARAHPEQGRSSVRCQLLHPDGTLTQLIQPE